MRCAAIGLASPPPQAYDCRVAQTSSSIALTSSARCNESSPASSGTTWATLSTMRRVKSARDGKTTTSSRSVTITSVNPADSNSLPSSPASPSPKAVASGATPTRYWPAAFNASCTGLCARARHTTRSARPPDINTRRTSAAAAGRSAKYCKPCWQSTTSNAASGSGNAAASPSSHSIGAPAGSGRDWPTAIMAGLMSRATTRPRSPTKAVASRATIPVPVARSRMRSPGWMAASARRTAVQGRNCQRTKKSS
jgi:hypothetical protein